MDFSDIKDIIWGSYPDARIKSIHFQDVCECLSEVTLEPCWLDIDIQTSITPGYNFENTEKCIRDWAHSHLTWMGCEACDNELLIDLNIYGGRYQADWISRKPIKRMLNNSTLYTGQKAIDKVIEMHKVATGVPVNFIVHMGDWNGHEHSTFVMRINKIDKYADGHIAVYTPVGVLPIYPENPVSTLHIVEVVEVPFDYK